MNSWYMVIVVIILIGVYVLYSKGKLSGVLRNVSWLSKLRPSEYDADDLVERIKAQTEYEQERTETLKLVLDARKELSDARLVNDKLRKEIDSVGHKTVDNSTTKGRSVRRL